MLDALYYYLKGAMSFSLMIAGLSSLLGNRTERGLRAFGCLYMAVGALFTMSALDPIVRLPMVLDNVVYQALLLVVGLSLINLSLYLFGNERSPGAARRLAWGGIAYQTALVVIPLLDFLSRQAPAVTNIEDSLVRGPLHAIAAQAGYAWPIVATLCALAIARWTPADVMAEKPEARHLRIGFCILVPLFMEILVSLAFSLKHAYRAGQLVLEALLLAWSLYIATKPRSLVRLRSEIGEEHARRLSLDASEAALIEKRLAGLSARREIALLEGLDLKRLAAHVGIPAYRLSVYFSTCLGTTFPVWRNRLRMEYVLERMAERPDLTILEISLEAGYRSKATFNDQFSRIVGMSPSEYRQGLGVTGPAKNVRKNAEERRTGSN